MPPLQANAILKAWWGDTECPHVTNEMRAKYAAQEAAERKAAPPRRRPTRKSAAKAKEAITKELAEEKKAANKKAANKRAANKIAREEGLLRLKAELRIKQARIDELERDL